MMRTAEAHETHWIFNLMTQLGSHRLDGSYGLDEDYIIAFARRAVAGGHRLGLHYAYESGNDQGALSEEIERIRRFLGDVAQASAGLDARGHYLRMTTPDTWNCLADAGVSDDWTLGFAEAAGFRAGTAKAYRPIDLRTGRIIPIVVHPLIAMDVTLMSPRYSGLTHDQSVDRVLSIWDAMRPTGGDFVLLWHNDSLITAGEKAAFRKLLKRFAPRSGDVAPD